MGYRKLRRLRYTLTGRNEFNRGEAVQSWEQEWEAIQGLLTAQREPARLIEKQADGFQLWETKVARMWTPPGAESNFVNMLTGEILGNIYHSPLRPIGRDTVAIDCGANVGFFSRYALDRGARLVVAFEPSPNTAECLKRNLAKEIKDGRAIVIEKGLWDRETTLAFSTAVAENPGAHHVVEDSTGGDFQIPVTTIDLALKELGIQKLDHMKMDIEGSELKALAGGTETLRRDLPVCSIATEHTDDLWANAAAVVKTMQGIDAGYRYVCTEAHVYDSPSRGVQLTPFTLQFTRR